jgi:hypothetical protein
MLKNIAVYAAEAVYVAVYMLQKRCRRAAPPLHVAMQKR